MHGGLALILKSAQARCEVVKMQLCYQQEQDVRKRYTMFNFIIGLFLTIISVFGLVGNIVAIIVLSRPTMKGSFSSLLIGKSYFLAM